MHARLRSNLIFAALLIAIAALVAGMLAGQGKAVRGRKALTPSIQIEVPRGNRLQIAFVGASDFPEFTESFRHAIQMAIEAHPTIRGFPVRINEYDPPCFSGPDARATNAAVAMRIVAHSQNAGVLGHLCSNSFASALPIYEGAGVVTISGSATDAGLAALGPTVFNRTIVTEPAYASWYELVKQLPSEVVFRQEFEAEVGTLPLEFTDLYYDAATLLLQRLEETSRLSRRGSLVIDRAALARAVRSTASFRGVSCTIAFDASGNRVDDRDALARCASS
jgi:ABC-type branched-subunit amino acid transport system substrate-binding protein